MIYRRIACATALALSVSLYSPLAHAETDFAAAKTHDGKPAASGRAAENERRGRTEPPAATEERAETRKPSTNETTSETGLPKADMSRNAAGARVKEKLHAEAFVKGAAKSKVEDLVTQLTTELTGSGEAETDQEAMAAIEAAIEAEESKTTEELDLLAEVKIRQGKKSEARATLLERLQANPHTQTAYEKLITLETEAGLHQELDTYVKGKKVKFDVRPVVKEGRTLVPIRALVEALGAEVKWDAESRVVTIVKDGVTIELQIDNKMAVVNGEQIPLETPAQIEDGRTVVPARFISEGLGLYVSWLAQHRTILITEEPMTEEPAAEEPATEEPATEEPATEEPATEEPAAEEPATEEPATEEPATEEPATEEPATEEPATEEPATEEPATNP